MFIYISIHKYPPYPPQKEVPAMLGKSLRRRRRRRRR